MSVVKADVWKVEGPTSGESDGGAEMGKFRLRLPVEKCLPLHLPPNFVSRRSIAEKRRMTRK